MTNFLPLYVRACEHLPTGSPCFIPRFHWGCSWGGRSSDLGFAGSPFALPGCSWLSRVAIGKEGSGRGAGEVQRTSCFLLQHVEVAFLFCAGLGE